MASVLQVKVVKGSVSVSAESVRSIPSWDIVLIRAERKNGLTINSSFLARQIVVPDLALEELRRDQANEYATGLAAIVNANLVTRAGEQ